MLQIYRPIRGMLPIAIKPPILEHQWGDLYVSYEDYHKAMEKLREFHLEIFTLLEELDDLLLEKAKKGLIDG